MKKWILFLLLPAIACFAHAQNYIPKISSYTTKDGLSSDKVYAIHKDKRGFLWIGTEEGLCRFDGKEFKVYAQDKQPNMTIRSIHDIFEDDKGYLWLIKKRENYGHDYLFPEINLFNLSTGTFTSPEAHFGERMPFKSSDVDFLKKLKDGRLYFYCQILQKGYTYEASTGFQPFVLPEEILGVGDMILQKDGFFLIKGKAVSNSNDWRIYKADQQGNLLAEGVADLTMPIEGQNKTQLVQFKGSNYIKGGFNLAAYNIYDPDISVQKDANIIPQELIDQTAWNEKQELLWLKSKSYIRAIKPDGSIVFQKKEKLDDQEIPILFDGNITWLSNKREGLIAIQLEPNHFTHFRFFEQDFDNSVRGIIQDDQENVWVSTLAGINKINQDHHISKMDKTEFPFTRFRKDSLGNLWYYHLRQLVRHHTETGQKTYFPLSGLGIETWDFLILAEDEVWFTGYNGVIYTLNPQTGKIRVKSQIPSNTDRNCHIYQYILKPDKNIWLCTSQGLYEIGQDGKTLAIYNENQAGIFRLPFKNVHHLYQDKAGLIWLATSDAGLLCLKPAEEGLRLEKQYTISDGLSSNALHAIYEDEADYLWISSDHGLMQFDKLTGHITKYFMNNGLVHNEFNRIAHFKSTDGKLYFGGLLGLTTFHPKHFANQRNKDMIAPLVITEFQQFSGEQESFRDMTPQLLQTNTITLHPSDQFFRLKVTLLDYQSENTSSYQYRIKGLYDWQYSTSGELGISGLPYGNHHLEIKAKNSDQQDALNDLSIAIRVQRPFYLQWWFILTSLGIVALGIWWLIKRRTRRLLLQQETEQLKTLDQMKSRFFTNIAHELRTPLTLISLPLENVIRNFENMPKSEMLTQLKSMNRSKRDISGLLNEILDLSKLNAGQLRLEPQGVHLKSFIERLVKMFHTAAVAKGIEFQFSSFISENAQVLLDSSKVEMIINNLISNALKFTPKGGIITIHTDWTSSQEFLFKIQDSGRGIREEDLPHVFKRYFQTKAKEPILEGGSGIGLAICKELTELMNGNIQIASEWGVGSTFSLQIPLETINQDNAIFPQEVIEGLDAEPLLINVDQPANHSETKPTLLIVEDHPSLQQHLQNILSPQYNIRIASNGVEALQILPNIDCDLILSDVMMPEMDGFTFLEKVKKEDRYCSIPFILLTARTTIKDKLNGLRIGVDAYMTKPFAVEELLLRVKHLLANVRNRGEEFYVVEESPSIVLAPTKIKPELAPVLEAPIVKEDLDWLQQLEEIAQREIKNTNYNVEDLAKELLMSRRQLFRKIKKITGLTPKKYLNAIRLQKAKTIMETEKVHTLTEVCYAVGFENTTHFANLFQTEFGFRPHSLLQKTS